VAPAEAAAMQSSIVTYRESLSQLTFEVDDATADEAPAPSAPVARGGDLSTTPPSSGRCRPYSRPRPGTGTGSDGHPRCSGQARLHVALARSFDRYNRFDWWRT
jgi:hypothetical protein